MFGLSEIIFDPLLFHKGRMGNRAKEQERHLLLIYRFKKDYQTAIIGTYCKKVSTKEGKKIDLEITVWNERQDAGNERRAELFQSAETLEKLKLDER